MFFERVGHEFGYEFHYLDGHVPNAYYYSYIWRRRRLGPKFVSMAFVIVLCASFCAQSIFYVDALVHFLCLSSSPPNR